jgi:adenylyltransferase/sulfurtransferase
MKILVGEIDALTSGLLVVDVWANLYQTFKMARNPSCAACQGRYEFLTASGGSRAATLCGRDAVQLSPAQPATLDLAQTAQRLASLGQTSRNDYLLKFKVSDLEMTLFSDGRAIVKGTSDPARARSFYAKYVGA